MHGAGCRPRRYRGRRVAGDLRRATSARRTSPRRRQAADQRRLYAAPGALQLNQWALAGAGRVGGESAVRDGAGARSCSASTRATCTWCWDPATDGQPVRFRVTHRRARARGRSRRRRCSTTARQRARATPVSADAPVRDGRGPHLRDRIPGSRVCRPIPLPLANGSYAMSHRHSRESIRSRARCSCGVSLACWRCGASARVGRAASPRRAHGHHRDFRGRQ